MIDYRKRGRDNRDTLYGSDAKDQQIHIRLTPRDQEMLDAAVEMTGLSKSEFIRRAIAFLLANWGGYMA